MTFLIRGENVIREIFIVLNIKNNVDLTTSGNRKLLVIAFARILMGGLILI